MKIKRITVLTICLGLVINLISFLPSYGETYENKATCAIITATSVPQSNPLQYTCINDGVKNTSHAEYEGLYQIAKGGAEILFDFISVTEFNKIVIYEAVKSNLNGYTVEVSQDKLKWIVVSESSEIISENKNGDANYYGEIEFSKQAARFLKLTIKSTSDLGTGYLEEAEIYDTLPLTEPEYAPFSSFTLSLPQGVKTEYESVDYSQIIKEEAAWIRGLSINSPGSDMHGAIKRNYSSGNGYCTVDPYYATLGCLGLLDAGGEENINAVKNWIDWYIAHINEEPDYLGVEGTIYTWYVNKNDISDYYKDEESYSASDSRGSTFVILLKKLYDVTGDKEFINSRKDKIEFILDSALYTWDNNYNLTASKNDGTGVKYLQDNVQIQAALRAVTELSDSVFEDLRLKEKYEEKLSLHKAAMEKMYIDNKDSFLKDNNRKEYVYYITSGIKLCDWSVFYGDAVSQIFPILYDVEDNLKAEILYNRFSGEQYGRVARYGSGVYPWMATAFLSAKMNDYVRLNEQLATAKKLYINTGRSSMWNVYESGNTIRAAKTMRDKLNLAYTKDAFFDEAMISYITDGDLSTASFGKEFIIDLGEAHTVNKAVIKSDGEYTVSCSLGGQLYSEIGSSDCNVYDFDKITARYFKFTFSEPTEVSEAELYFEKNNLCTGATRKSGTGTITNASADYALDNSTSTKWVSKMAANPYYSLDMGKVSQISTVEILWDSFNMPQSYSVELAVEDGKYEVAAICSDNSANSVVKFTPKNARYIRIKSTDDVKKSIGIFEIRAYDESENPVSDPEPEKLPESLNPLSSFGGFAPESQPVTVLNHMGEYQDITGYYKAFAGKVPDILGYSIKECGVKVSSNGIDYKINVPSGLELTKDGGFGILFYGFDKGTEYYVKPYVIYKGINDTEYVITGETQELVLSDDE